MTAKRACEFRSALGHFKEFSVLFFDFVFFLSVFCFWALLLLLLCRLLWPLAFIWQHSVTVLYLRICALCLFFANAFWFAFFFLFAGVFCAGLCCVGYLVHKIFPAGGRRLFAGVRACHQSVLWPGAVVPAAASGGGGGVAVTLSASGL